ncbi:hypothetical protein [Streptomyces fradiae]
MDNVDTPAPKPPRGTLPDWRPLDAEIVFKGVCPDCLGDAVAVGD